MIYTASVISRLRLRLYYNCSQVHLLLTRYKHYKYLRENNHNLTILQNVYSDFIADIIRHFFRTLVKLLTTLIIGRIVFHRLLTHLKLLIAAVVGCKRLKCAYPMIIQGQFGLTTLRV